MFKDATHPAMSANPQGIDLSVKGEIVYACKQNVQNIGEKFQSFIRYYIIIITIIIKIIFPIIM